MHTYTNDGARRVPRSRFVLTCIAIAGLTVPACGSDSFVFPPIPTSDVQWVTLVHGAGNEVPVAIVKPENYSETGRHPVILALPWGQGTPDLALGMIDAYWGTEAPNRGYVVISPAIRGSTLDTEADSFMPVLFGWMEANLSFDPDRIVLVGASNGGRGIFHTLVWDPTRFSALIGMPGSYTGSVGDITEYSPNPAWLMVGETDTGWRTAAEDTKLTLEAAGVPTLLEVLPGQGHVLFVPQATLMDWVDNALGGSG